jgi:hypothetical protein
MGEYWEETYYEGDILEITNDLSSSGEKKDTSGA